MDTTQVSPEHNVVTGESTSSEHTMSPTHLEDSKVQSMLIKYSGWGWRKAEVTDAGTEDIVYKVKYQLRKPQLTIQHVQETSTFGSATYHFRTRRIDLDIRGQKLHMKIIKALKRDYTYDSIAFPNQTMTWVFKYGWKTVDYVCLNESQLPVAKITAESYLTKKIGKVDFLGSVGDSQAAREEIVVTGLTLIMYYLATSD